MDENALRELLNKIADGELTPDEAAKRMQVLPYENVDYAKIDMHRKLRTGRSEVIFGLGKTADQISGIIERMIETETLILCTKATNEQFEAVRNNLDEAKLTEKNLTLTYFIDAKMIVVSSPEYLTCTAYFDKLNETNGSDTESCSSAVSRRVAGFEPASIPKKPYIAVVTAGTADIPIAEEAALTVELYGGRAHRIYDVGVAGLHRLLDKLEEIRGADVLIVVAGMEGALASVVGGLVSRPVIAVPTSVGYGTSMGGLTALFSMLNSCSLGVSVMNIDNGFGAGNLAMMITDPK